MTNPDKQSLLVLGMARIRDFCALNNIASPSVVVYKEGRPTFGVCAYYRSNAIHIWPRSCAAIGVAASAWSAPGYVVDRTPFGVLAHELGHHMDKAHGARGGRVAAKWQRLTGAKAITGYAPNVNEWFAEMFRLYVTNPDLLLHVRPNVHMLMSEAWRPVELRTWQQVLAPYPRQLAAAKNKIKAAAQ